MKTRYRVNWRGKLILQVQYEYNVYGYFGDIDTYTAWRDATVEDVTEGIVV